jgi:hypothetical protein
MQHERTLMPVGSTTAFAIQMMHQLETLLIVSCLIAAGNWESSILVSDATRTRAVLFYFLNKSVSICLVSSCQTDALLLTFISNANLDSDRMGLSDSSF